MRVSLAPEQPSLPPKLENAEPKIEDIEAWPENSTLPEWDAVPSKKELLSTSRSPEIKRSEAEDREWLVAVEPNLLYETVETLTNPKLAAPVVTNLEAEAVPAFTSSLVIGAVVPIPTLPAPVILSLSVGVEPLFDV